MQSVSSNAVYNERQKIFSEPIKISPIGDLPFDTIIQEGVMYQNKNASGKTFKVTWYFYEYDTNLSIQVSYGTHDGNVQQMSGFGRTWFQSYTEQNYLGSWSMFRKLESTFSVPSGQNVFAISSNRKIGIKVEIL